MLLLAFLLQQALAADVNQVAIAKVADEILNHARLSMANVIDQTARTSPLPLQKRDTVRDDPEYYNQRNRIAPHAENILNIYRNEVPTVMSDHVSRYSDRPDLSKDQKADSLRDALNEKWQFVLDSYDYNLEPIRYRGLSKRSVPPSFHAAAMRTAQAFESGLKAASRAFKGFGASVGQSLDNAATKGSEHIKNWGQKGAQHVAKGQQVAGEAYEASARFMKNGLESAKKHATAARSKFNPKFNQMRTGVNAGFVRLFENRSRVLLLGILSLSAVYILLLSLF